MADWLKTYAPERFQMWEGTNRRWWSVVQEHIQERLEKDDTPEEKFTLQERSQEYKTLQRHVASNPYEEDNDLASVEDEDDFIPEDHDLEKTI